MITLRGMAEHRFSNVYNYQCLTKVMYLFMWILIFPFIPFPSYLLSSFITEEWHGCHSKKSRHGKRSICTKTDSEKIWGALNCWLGTREGGLGQVWAKNLISKIYFKIIWYSVIRRQNEILQVKCFSSFLTMLIIVIK